MIAPAFGELTTSHVFYLFLLRRSTFVRDVALYMFGVHTHGLIFTIFLVLMFRSTV